MMKNPLSIIERQRAKQQGMMLQHLAKYVKEVANDCFVIQVAQESGSRADINAGKLVNALRRLSTEAHNLGESLKDLSSDQPRLF